ncbi:MAG: YbaK/EbsC family protein, partial [Fretibacterium sp.]|nr:YbaK/EbsC family protein [Fretibacterium sp.]
TVSDAARTLSVPEAEILKSLILLVDGAPALVLMSGINKVDSRAVARALGGRRSKMASPDFVLERFGFQVGGVPPVGYSESLPALLDDELFQYETVWAAAGTDRAFFPISPGRLLEITRGIRSEVKKLDPTA